MISRNAAGGGFDVPVHEPLAGGVEDADVHGLHVEIDAAIVTMLTVVASHVLSSCAGRALALRQPTAIPWEHRGRAE
jgi:hypothetical protein